MKQVVPTMPSPSVGTKPPEPPTSTLGLTRVEPFALPAVNQCLGIGGD
jgi:hypothetical protein